MHFPGVRHEILVPSDSSPIHAIDVGEYLDGLVDLAMSIQWVIGPSWPGTVHFKNSTKLVHSYRQRIG